MMNNDLHTGLLSDITDGRDLPHEKTVDERYAGSPGEHQPIIGIPLPVQQDKRGPLLLADAVGTWAVERMLGKVFLIPLWPFPTHTHRYQSLWSLMQTMDGLLLPASVPGTNWYAHWQESENHPGPQTWPISWELALAQLATYVGMPILALADGAEKWNIALGGKKAEPLEETMPTATPDTWDRHNIRVRAQSKLATYIQPVLTTPGDEQKPWELAFMPHQEVEKLGPGLRSCAQSEGTTVAAFERRDPAFGLGIVGRLDWALDQSYVTALFERFFSACRSFDRARQQNNTWESSRDTICTALDELVTHNQPLIPISQTMQEENLQRTSHLSGSLASSSSSPNGSGEQQERLRQRSRQPTKEELNRVRRQRLKIAVR